MLFKVYAQNCVRPKGMRISPVDTKAIDEAVLDVVNTALNEGLVDCSDDEGEVDYAKLNRIHERVWNYWLKHKNLSAGDWMIQEVDNINQVVVPSICSNDAHIIF